MIREEHFFTDMGVTFYTETHRRKCWPGYIMNMKQHLQILRTSVLYENNALIQEKRHIEYMINSSVT